MKNDEVIPFSSLGKAFSIPENIDKKDIEDWAWQSKFFKAIEEREVPLDMIKERKGSYNKDIQDFETLEYFPEEYTLSELNRLFPGWWEEEMKYEFHRFNSNIVRLKF